MSESPESEEPRSDPSPHRSISDLPGAGSTASDDEFADRESEGDGLEEGWEAITQAPAPPRKTRTRRELLLNGRRVTIRDLVNADLLRVGERLTCRGHHAEVTKNGRLRLDDDGQEFATPSRAASAVFGGGSFDGWIYWTTISGMTLYQLRARLLESAAREVAQEADPDDPVTNAAEARFQTLNDLLARAQSGRPQTMAVRELLGLWGFSDRDRTALARVDADLDNHGLRTDPDYRDVDLDTLVRVDVAPFSPAMSLTAESPQGIVSLINTHVAANMRQSRQNTDASAAEIGLTLGNLIHKSKTLTSIAPSASIEQAITIMQLNGFSQLPVMTGDGKLHGVVSWQSIAESKHQNPQATFRAAIDHAPTVLGYDHRLLDALDVIQQAGFVFVRDSSQKVYGIITAADVVGMYDDAATPFFLIGEIDQELRQLIEDTYDEQAIINTLSTQSPFSSFEKMTMGQYKAVLENRALWDQLGWPLDRKIFIARLGEIVTIRNDVMHFNRDSVPRPELEKLRLFLDVVRRYRG